MDTLFSSFLEVKTYLLRVTGDNAYRSLVIELQSLHLNPVFLVKFIANLGKVSIPHHGQVLEIGKKLDGPIFLSEGDFVLRHASSKRTPWSVPLRTWYGWKEAVRSEVCQLSITAMRASNCLQIGASDLSRLAEEFPTDYSSLEKWVIDGLFPETTSEDHEFTEMGDDDLEKLFKGNEGDRPHHWSLPFVRQNCEMDCGPACLATISLYYGKDLSIHFWRSKLSTGREGTTLFDLAETSERFGFTTYRLGVPDIQSVQKNMFPFIALRKSHYLVVYKLGKDSITVADPARGIVEMRFEHFYNGFEEACLFLKPNLEFERISDSQSRWKHYLFLLEGVKIDVLLAFACGLLGVVLSLVPPAITQLIIDDVIASRDFEFLAILLSVSFVVTFVSVYVGWAKGYYFNYVITRFNYRATAAFVQKVLSLPYHFFASRHVGDFTHRIDELSQLRSFVTGTLFEVSMNIVMLVIYAIALIMISPTVGIVTFVLAPMMLIIPWCFAKRLFSLFGELFNLRSSQTSRLTDFVNGLSVIKSTRAEYACKSKFERELFDLTQVENKFFMTSTNVSSLAIGYYQFANLAIVGTAAWLGAQGDLSSGRVIFLIIVSSRVFGPVLSLTRQWDRFVATKSAVSRLNDIFLSPSEKISKKSGSNVRNELKGEIEFREVWFRFGGENSEWVLKDLNFKINAGDKVAIVGPNGSGKSTIACLLARIYEPTKGSIFIDGRDYREYDLDSLRSQIGLLHQDPVLFNCSILENIGFNEHTPDLEKATQAADRASVLSTILERPEGFNFYINHGGNGFSEGEKQRIALARLFYSEPGVMILDEATAALDGISERKILSMIAKEMANRTVLSIAHRLSTLSISNLVLVLNHGRVVGFGPIEYMKCQNTVFQELFNLTDESTAENMRRVS